MHKQASVKKRSPGDYITRKKGRLYVKNKKRRRINQGQA